MIYENALQFALDHGMSDKQLAQTYAVGNGSKRMDRMLKKALGKKGLERVRKLAKRVKH